MARGKRKNYSDDEDEEDDYANSSDEDFVDSRDSSEVCFISFICLTFHSFVSSFLFYIAFP